jgi:hypothetical protein
MLLPGPLQQSASLHRERQCRVPVLAAVVLMFASGLFLHNDDHRSPRLHMHLQLQTQRSSKISSVRCGREPRQSSPNAWMYMANNRGAFEQTLVSAKSLRIFNTSGEIVVLYFGEKPLPDCAMRVADELCIQIRPVEVPIKRDR